MSRYVNANLARLYLNTAACEQIKSMPTADVQEVRHGKWEKIEKENVWGKMTPVLRCSICKKWKTRNLGIDFPFDYCPNCGAKMEEEKTTNYEKIKNLTLEEMIEFIHCEGACNYCVYADDDDCKGLKCREGIREWLNQEVSGNDKL